MDILPVVRNTVPEKQNQENKRDYNKAKNSIIAIDMKETIVSQESDTKPTQH